MPSREAADWIELADTRDGESRALADLFEVSQALLASDLALALRHVLRVVERHHGATGSQVVLDGGAPGVQGWQVSSGTMASGSGAGARRAGARGRPDGNDVETIVSAPILIDGEVVGTLSVELRHARVRERRRALAFLSAAGSMVAQAVRADWRVRDERSRAGTERPRPDQGPGERYDFSVLIGTAGSMRQVSEQVAQMSAANTTVLLLGGPGTGKALIARTIHQNSARSARPFVSVTCAALPQELVELELFGDDRGARQGSDPSRPGQLELCKGGTLFLEDLCDLSLAAQERLLRVVQRREVQRVGSDHAFRTDVRLIVGSCRNLDRAVASGELRHDLRARLSVFSISIPSLSERVPDIVRLADHFLATFAREYGRPASRLSRAVRDSLTRYHWPGNVGELASVIERAVVACDGDAVQVWHLPPALQGLGAARAEDAAPLGDRLEAFEQDVLQEALRRASGNRAKAARLVGTTERIFNYRVRKYGIDWRQFRKANSR